MGHDLKGVVEPSDAERTEWPDATRDYVWELEQALTSLESDHRQLVGLARRINMSAVRIPGINGESAVSADLIAEMAAALASQDQGGGDRG